MTSQEIDTYVTRDSFLDTITERLRRTAPSNIAFWKHSPGMLPVDSAFVVALERRVAAGAHLLMIVTHSPSVDEWFTAVSWRLSAFPSARVVLLHSPRVRAV